MALEEFNKADAETLRPQLLALTAAPAWADPLLAGRPYPDRARLLERSEELVLGLAEDHVDGALADHPRIGERSDSARAASEQAGMEDADDELRAAMARGNAAYEERFGRIYLVAAAGRSAEELLALLEDRLENDPETEVCVVRRELAGITRLRLLSLLEELG